MSACNPKSGDDGPTSNPPPVEDVAIPAPEPAGNPPAPEHVVVPEPGSAHADNAAPKPFVVKIGRDVNGHCRQEFEADCPAPEAGADCNPPAPIQVVCPTDLTTLIYDHMAPGTVPKPTSGPVSQPLLEAPHVPTNPPEPEPVSIPPAPVTP